MALQLKPIGLMLQAALLGSLLSGCFFNDDNDYHSSSTEMSSTMLSQAASFLGAASGKEEPLSIDSVVFINTALGINDVPNDPQNLYGDLWVVLRNANGEPILDSNGCIQPVASEPVTWPDDTVHDTVPMVLEEFMDSSLKCSVVEGYEEYTIELEIGRLNMVRNMVNNPNSFARALEEAIDTINAAVAISTDPAGRLVLTTDVAGELVETTIDSPRENLALYYAIMKYGRIAGYGPEKHEGGETIPPQWVEIRDDLEMGSLAYLRDGLYGRTTGVDLINGYADLRNMTHFRQLDYAATMVPYVQYVADGMCHYYDQEDYAYSRIFNSEPYAGFNIEAFTKQADDSRRVIVFMHDVIQDIPDTDPATLPTPAGGRIDQMKAAATFLGAASSKTVPLSVDGLVFINTVLSLNDVDFSYKGEIYGDLWELVRNDNGEPVLDGNGCPQPVASESIVWPDDIERDTVPMELDEENECIVVEGYEDYVVELELGRLNVVRVALTNPRVLNRQLYEVVTTLNNAVSVKLDVAGRLAYGLDEGGETVFYTVDSPLAGLALYWALMKWGKLEGDIELMEDGTWVNTHISITLDDAILDAEGLGYLKHGTAACQLDEADCGAKQLASGYVDYTGFNHNSEDVFAGVDVSFVERQSDLSCAYIDKTEDLWERILESDSYDGSNIDAFVHLAEDTRKIIQFTHTVIQDPVTP